MTEMYISLLGLSEEKIENKQQQVVVLGCKKKLHDST
jgi:hypothetical protein